MSEQRPDTEKDADPNAVTPPEQARVSVLSLLPNMITLTGMSLGLTAIRFAIDGRIATAVFLLVLAAVVDGLDGLLARRLGAESKLGAQLDSLSDFLCFGVAPALVIHQVHLLPAGEFGWIFALLFVAAACLRLARFNVMSGTTEDKVPPRSYFVGVPAPAGAMLALLPVFLTLAGVFDAGTAPVAVAFWLGLVGALMVSKLHTPSPKALKVPRRLIAVILFATVLLIGLSFSRPWFLLVALDLAYVAIVLRAVLIARGRLFG